MFGALLFAGCIIFFYSGTFLDTPGLKGLYQTFSAWWHTGKAGNGHEKEWYYWLKLFGRYEWPTCAGLLMTLVCFFPRTPRLVWALAVSVVALWLAWCGIHFNNPKFAVWLHWPYLLICAAFLFAVVYATERLPRLIRALAIYGVGTFAAYSIIHYKTPWCVISLTWPFLLLFGWGVDFCLKKYGTPVGVLSVTMLAANLCDMVALNFFRFTNPKEPYVYVQTYEDINLLMKPLNELVALDPENYQLDGHILMESYHPLPWLLGDFPNIGYYDSASNPPKMDADILLVDETRIDDVENSLREKYFTTMLTLRDAEDPAKLYLNVKKFRSVFPGRKPDFAPSPTPTPAPAKGK